MSSHERLLSFIARIQRCRRTVAEMLDKSEGGIAPAPSRPGEARECEREVYAQPFCPFCDAILVAMWIPEGGAVPIPYVPRPVREGTP